MLVFALRPLLALADVAAPTPQAERINLFILGAIMLAATAVAAIFLRSWRRSRDGLFLMFGIAFAMLALIAIGQAVYPSEEDRIPLYALRVAAYGAIITAIVLKNRARSRASKPPNAGAIARSDT